MTRRLLTLLGTTISLSLLLAGASNGASTGTVIAIHSGIYESDPYHEIPDDQRQYLQDMLVYAVDKDAKGLVRYGKECNADKDSRLSLCLSWCLYQVDPMKYVTRFVDLFPISANAPDGAWTAVCREYEWTMSVEKDVFVDPFTCLGQIAVSGNQDAIEKLLLMSTGGGGENAAIILRSKYRMLQKRPQETIRVAAALFDKGRAVFPLDGGTFASQEELDQVKASLRPLLPGASLTERGIIRDILDYYVVGPPGFEDEPGYTIAPYRRPLSEREMKHLAQMLKAADEQGEAGVEKYWWRMDETLKRKRVLVLAYQWYLYASDPKKWRDTFVKKWPTDLDGVSDYYRISHAYCPKRSAGSAGQDLGKIAQEGNIQAIDRLVAGMSFSSPWVETSRVLCQVLEQQPEKTIRAMAAVQDGRAWVYRFPDSVFRALGRDRFVGLREQLRRLESNATERERRVLLGFMTFSTEEKGYLLAPDEVVRPLLPKE